jgi:hypothetical protein
MEQQQRSDGADRSTHPKGSVNNEIDRAAHLAGNELIYSRIDRRVFSSNAETSEKSENSEAKKIQENALAMVASE